jgi:transcriptional regulator with XRE-family HTH domain
MPEMNRHLMAQRLKQLRIANGLTQSEVAGKIGVHKTTIMRWEKGEGANHIKLPIIAELACILHTSPSYLMGWTDEPLALEEEKPLQAVAQAWEAHTAGYIGENEASVGLKYLLAFYGLPWQEYNDAILLKLINSDLLRNLLINCLSLLQQE